jgi:hypothetical protein
VHNGDLAYDLDDLNGAVGEQFMDNIQEISSRVPYTVSPGNHEYLLLFSFFHIMFSVSLFCCSSLSFLYDY